MLRGARFVLVLAVVFASAGSAHAQQLRGLDADVEKAISEWEVPGLGVASVDGGAGGYAWGLGGRRPGSAARVDENRMFAIGSSSKAFTALLLATPTDEGRAKWDDRVIEHLDWFQMFDPYVTREMTLRDLLSHRSGLSRGDLLWYGSDLTREDIVRRVRWLEPSWSFRSQFGYQNSRYLAAGQGA